MCTVCGNSGGGWCPCCTPDRSIDHSFRCDNCGETSEALTLQDGWKMCNSCINAYNQQERMNRIKSTTTIQRIESAMKLSDLAERIESAYHLILQLKKSKEEGYELYKFAGMHIIDKPIRIAEAHLRRLENRFDNLIL